MKKNPEGESHRTVDLLDFAEESQKRFTPSPFASRGGCDILQAELSGKL